MSRMKCNRVTWNVIESNRLQSNSNSKIFEKNWNVILIVVDGNVIVIVIDCLNKPYPCPHVIIVKSHWSTV